MRDPDADIEAMLGGTLERVGASESVREASARLQTMIDAARGAPKPLVDPRTLPVRFTRLKAFALSAAHYLVACQDEIKNSIAIRMGAGFHAAIFENRPLVCFDGRRAGKAWERFQRAHLERNAVILNVKEYAIASGMVRAVQQHPRAMELLLDGTTTELGIDWAIGSRKCRSTPDAFAARFLTDLKSTRCAEPRWLAREALQRHYHAQLAFYADALEADRGHLPDDEYLVCVENVKPFNVVVLRMPDATREVGRRLCGGWWQQLQLAEASGHYGGYVESDIDLELPVWDSLPEHQAVEIDGELVDTGDIA